MIKTPAFRIIQWSARDEVPETTLYITAIPLKYIADRSYIDKWTPDNRDGYQRDVDLKRVDPKKGSLTRYLLDEMGALPSSIILNVRENDKIRFEEKEKVSDKVSHGTLYIDEDIRFYIIDGQHRLEALKRLIPEKEEFKDYPVPVTILTLNDVFDEMVMFHIHNSRQKKIDTSLAIRNIQRMLERRRTDVRYKWLEEQLLGPKEKRVARAAFVVDILREDPNSPFNGLITYPTEITESGQIKDQVLIKYISELYKEKVFELMDDSEFAELYMTYWNVIKKLYPRCFEEPEKYRLLTHTGIATFTYLFPGIYSKCLLKNPTNLAQCMEEMLNKLKERVEDIGDPDIEKPIDEEWWSKKSGSVLSKVTGEKWFKYNSEMFMKKINKLSGGENNGSS